MSWLSEVTKLEYKHIWLCILFFLGAVGAGFLIIFQFRPELVERYDIFKLLVMSLSLTLPLVVINAVPSAFLNHDPLGDDENETAKNVAITKGALMFNAMVIYPSLLCCHLASINFKGFLGIVAGVEVILFLIITVGWLIQKADRK